MNGLFCKCLLLCFWIVGAVFAANHEKLSEFEQKIVNAGLKKNGLEIDKNPGGKIIRNFYYYTDGPFSPDDKLLAWLDRVQFHTRDSAIRSQLWMEPGQVYHPGILVQNEQALLNPAVRSFALIFPVQKIGDASASEVDLLIVTKDVFSWQGTYSFAGSGSSLSQLSLGFAQTNLLGLNKTIGANFGLTQALINLSGYYSDPSLFSTKNQLLVQQGVFLDRKTGGYEGVSGALSLSYPLLIESAKWGYNTSFSYNSQPVYDFQGDKIRLYKGEERKYHQIQIVPSITVTRSLGEKIKNNFSFGYGLNYGKYEALESGVTEDFKEHVLPRSELQSYLILGYNYFQNKFIALYDYETFAMTEWVQLGPSLGFVNHFALNALGGDHNFYRPGLALGMSASPTKTSVISVSATGQTRIQNGFINNQAIFSFETIFPSMGPVGRFVLNTKYSKVWDNQNNLRYSLGGSSGLRGVPYRYYQGTNLFLSNLELRTASLPIWVLRLGLVAFYDFGAAFDGEGDFNPTHDVGAGIRILVVPWNRVLIRIDVATPVAGPLHGFSNTLVTFGVGQAF